MINTLVIVVHPSMDDSKINKRWIEELNKYRDRYTVHNLYQTYPDEKIDIAREQELIASFDRIVFQFPFYWFNCTPLLKKWLDEVLTYGWAYGSNSGYKMKDKKIGLAMSVGIDQKEYHSSGKYKYNLEHLLAPFELTFEYIKSEYKGFFAYYGVERNSSEDWIEKSVEPYLDFIDKL